ncbi:hypothetical protein [Metabacillus sediminilitoris]|uniref:Uncharacterized protein n=1 Tax=Metabacillus sediminilitoris TaxID=2567941 RepID=A0A4V3WG44_9BACI|nr:hypothetical protein [Metabacillus sediminilitoris]QGQ46723.1 hypothetical protein GMB29_16715 [Metabacillus sediminilitoris]THF82873.1 hypothetical protein E6W99_00465 [Metabacillus sediminilitoris]
MQAFTPRRLTARPAKKRASLAAINHTALLGKKQQSMRKQPLQKTQLKPALQLRDENVLFHTVTRSFPFLKYKFYTNKRIRYNF